MSTLSTNDRLRIAIGGFTSFTGFIILILVVLSATNAADIQTVLQNDLMTAIIAFVSALDLTCGLLLIFKERRMKWLIPSHQKKPNDNIDQTNETPENKT